MSKPLPTVSENGVSASSSLLPFDEEQDEEIEPYVLGDAPVAPPPPAPPLPPGVVGTQAAPRANAGTSAAPGQERPGPQPRGDATDKIPEAILQQIRGGVQLRPPGPPAAPVEIAPLEQALKVRQQARTEIDNRMQAYKLQQEQSAGSDDEWDNNEEEADTRRSREVAEAERRKAELKPKAEVSTVEPGPQSTASTGETASLETVKSFTGDELTNFLKDFFLERRAVITGNEKAREKLVELERKKEQERLHKEQEALRCRIAAAGRKAEAEKAQKLPAERAEAEKASLAAEEAVAEGVGADHVPDNKLLTAFLQERARADSEETRRKEVEKQLELAQAVADEALLQERTRADSEETRRKEVEKQLGLAQAVADEALLQERTRADSEETRRKEVEKQLELAQAVADEALQREARARRQAEEAKRCAQEQLEKERRLRLEADARAASEKSPSSGPLINPPVSIRGNF